MESALATLTPMSGAAKKRDITRRRQLSDAEEQHAARLLAAWQAAKSRRRVSQKEMAAKHGVHPSVISQYLHGHIALNTKWQLRFSQYLQVPPQAIWPDWQYKDVAPGRLAPDAINIAREWANLSDAERGIVSALIESLSGR